MSRLNRVAALAALTVLVNLIPSASAQVTNNVFLRILLIKTSSGTGTAFTMDIEGRQYLITAKHMVAGWKGKHTISFRERGTWSPIEVTVYPCADPVDIAVLVPPRELTSTSALPLEPAGDTTKVIVTQEVFFIGFPFGSSASDNNPLFMYHPVPFAKHGILSTMYSQDGPIRVDAYNNPGFSGSPIVIRDLYAKDNVPTFYVLGVVQGYFPELTHVTTPKPVKPDEDLSKIEGWRIQEKDGKRFVLRDTPQMVPLNSGILFGYNIVNAVKVIHEHPEGPEISKQ